MIGLVWLWPVKQIRVFISSLAIPPQFWSVVWSHKQENRVLRSELISISLPTLKTSHRNINLSPWNLYYRHARMSRNRSSFGYLEPQISEPRGFFSFAVALLTFKSRRRIRFFFYEPYRNKTENVERYGKITEVNLFYVLNLWAIMSNSLEDSFKTWESW